MEKYTIQSNSIQKSGGGTNIKKEVDIDQLIKKYQFATEEILSKFREVKSPWLTEAYLFLVDNRIVSFVVMMEEDLKCGFLHYHIPTEHKEYFIKNYPVLNKKTNQILYVYTDSTHRRNGIASQLVDFVLKDLFKRKYSYVWLKKETYSRIYEKLGFKDFLKTAQEILIDSERFFQDYEQKVRFNKQELIDRFNDIRLVKVLE